MWAWGSYLEAEADQLTRGRGLEVCRLLGEQQPGEWVPCEPEKRAHPSFFLQQIIMWQDMLTVA